MTAPPLASARTYHLSIGDVCAKAGTRITVPLSIDELEAIQSGPKRSTHDWLRPEIIKVVWVLTTPLSVAYRLEQRVDDDMIRLAFAHLSPDRASAGANEPEKGRLASSVGKATGRGPLLQLELEVLATAPRSIVRHLTIREAILDDGRSVLLRGGSIEVFPDRTALLQNYPNPFNPETWIPYQLAETGEVTIRIYSLAGQLIRTMDLGHQPPGTYETQERAAHWDGRNDVGERVASGIYFYVMKADAYQATRRMLVVR